MDARRWVGAVFIGVFLAGLPGVPASSKPQPDDVTEYMVPTPASGPVGIAAGPDGNVWFTEAVVGKIGRITPNGVITEYDVPSAEGSPVGIAAGPDGNMWFAAGNAIGRVTPAGVITEYPLPDADANAVHIAAGPDGNVWFTESSAHRVGRITPTGIVTQYPVNLPYPRSTGYPGPLGIAAGPDGNMWFTGYEAFGIERIAPDGTVTTVIPDMVESVGITAGPDGNVWFAAGEGIYRVTPNGELSGHRGWTDYSAPSHITVGPDGNLWFTEVALSRLGRITPEGIISFFRLPAGHTAADITAGADGNLWFTEDQANRIGRISPTATPAVVRRSCPVTVTEHMPTPRKLGRRTLVDWYSTKKSVCSLVEPVVRCKISYGYPYSGRDACDVKVTKRRTIRVTSKHPVVPLTVTVIIRAEPKADAKQRWKRGSWHLTWYLR